MTEFKPSYYDSKTPWKKTESEFLIRGFALQEMMPPVSIHNGENLDYPWPWLFVFFETPVTLNSGKKDEIQCGKNTLMIWPPGSAHYYGNMFQQWTHSWMIVDSPDIRQYLKNWSMPIGTPFTADILPVFSRYLTLFYEELSQRTDDYIFQKMLFQLFLYDLYRQSTCYFVEVPVRIKNTVKYMNSHLQKDLSVKDLADLAGLSTPQYSFLFRKYYHIAPIQFLNKLRLDRAAQLLRLYPYSCQNIAEMCGFKDPLYFSRKFTQFWGIAPREYRQTIK